MKPTAHYEISFSLDDEPTRPYRSKDCPYSVRRNPFGCRHLARSDAQGARGRTIICAEPLRVRSYRACSTRRSGSAVDPIYTIGTLALPDRYVRIARLWFLLPLRVPLSG